MTFNTQACRRDSREPDIESLGSTKEAWSNMNAHLTQNGDMGRLRCPAPISRLRVEKIEGGLMVAGVVIANNCQIILPIFGFLFTLVGIVLTAAAYRGPAEDEPPENYADRLQFTDNARKLGPGCIVVGIVMLIAGFSLCVLTKRARRKQQTVGFHCPLHGDFYPLSPGISTRTLTFKSERKCLCWPRKRGPGAVAVGPPQCPHSQVSSKRSSLASSPLSQCPTPLPFLVKSGSVSGLIIPSAQLSPDPQFGSLRSLEPREVASFPLSRTPTPPPIRESFAPNGNVIHVADEESLVNSQFESVPVERTGPRKSVSILLPPDNEV
ncbi:uncharacterized protein LOC123670680 isoform X1 [Harmonia axyridis]|uniref:uncharacterized protein LOC123670680 isoform X1 n=2 Tax=Harmonia axyridis TaxID=115357 RepID=UPI001E276A57|nr:uncharacterized protein LOC123670680 isoform X1 [Harmonia axyridis]